MRILICEDDEAQLNWLACRLNHEGNFVSTADQGDQAFAKWQAGRPWDFVITDYLFVAGTKIRNGLDLVREIHSVDLSQQIIVQSGDWNLTVPAGVKLLRKPYPFQRLVRTMRGIHSPSTAVAPEAEIRWRREGVLSTLRVNQSPRTKLK